MNEPTREPFHVCEKCNHTFKELETGDSCKFSQPQVGDILLCGNCGAINQLGLTSLKEMTEEELATLNKDELIDLRWAQKKIRIRQRNN